MVLGVWDLYLLSYLRFEVVFSVLVLGGGFVFVFRVVFGFLFCLSFVSL